MSSMTRKHFRALADELRYSRPTYALRGAPDYELWRMVCRHMCGFCHQFNDNFDCERFLEACGYYSPAYNEKESKSETGEAT